MRITTIKYQRSITVEITRFEPLEVGLEIGAELSEDEDPNEAVDALKAFVCAKLDEEVEEILDATDDSSE